MYAGLARGGDREVFAGAGCAGRRRVAAGVGVTREAGPAGADRLAARHLAALGPEPALDHGARVGRAGDVERRVVDPAADRAVAKLPDGGEEVRADREVLGVLDAAVEQAGRGVDQPVAAAVLLVVQVVAGTEI